MFIKKTNSNVRRGRAQTRTYFQSSVEKLYFSAHQGPVFYFILLHVSISKLNLNICSFYSPQYNYWLEQLLRSSTNVHIRIVGIKLLFQMTSLYFKVLHRRETEHVFPGLSQSDSEEVWIDISQPDFLSCHLDGGQTTLTTI